MAAAGHLQYRPDIDGLRAIAVLSVVAFHARHALLPGGFVGVDIFFVISGFLITGILLRELENGTYSIRKFYARRIRRIFPALLVVLLATLIAGWFILIPQEYEKLGKHVVNSALSVANFGFWKESGYFDSTADLKPLLHLWSLGVEEQFYIIWPFLMAFFWRHGHHVRGLLLVLLLTSLAASAAFTADYPVPSFFLLHTRFWELMAGGLLAYYRPPLPRALAWLGLALITVSLCLFSDADAYPGWRAALPVLGAVLLMGTQGSALHRHLLSHRSMVWVGLISYPLYLWHWPLLSFARILYWQEPPAQVIGGLIIIAFLLAWLTYALVERPIRRGPQKRSAIFVLSILMILMALIGLGIRLTHGMRTLHGQSNPELQDLISSHIYIQAFPKCRAGTNWCFTAHAAPATAAIFGDSHAQHLFPGLAADTSDNWMMLGYSSCPPLTDIHLQLRNEPNICIERTQASMNLLLAHPEIHIVALSMLGPIYLDGSISPEQLGNHWKLTSTHPQEQALPAHELFYHGMDRTMTALEKAGKQVVLFADVPTLNFMAASCLPRLGAYSPAGAVKAPCTIDRALVDKDQAAYRAILLRLVKAHPHARLFDPMPLLCDAQSCRAEGDDMLLYSDSNHLSVRGSVMIAQHFLPWLHRGQ